MFPHLSYGVCTGSPLTHEETETKAADVICRSSLREKGSAGVHTHMWRHQASVRVCEPKESVPGLPPELWALIRQWRQPLLSVAGGSPDFLYSEHWKRSYVHVGLCCPCRILQLLQASFLFFNSLNGRGAGVGGGGERERDRRLIFQRMGSGVTILMQNPGSAMFWLWDLRNLNFSLLTCRMEMIVLTWKVTWGFNWKNKQTNK